MANWKTVKPTEEAAKPKKEHMGCKKRWKIVLPLILVTAIAVGAAVWALPHLPLKPQTHNGASYQGVLELWNIESFEGGVGSRESWLRSRAVKFEQANNGLFVHITTLTEAQLADKLAQGDSFDMICFSRGAGASVQDKLAAITFDLGGTAENFVLSGQLKGVQYAAPLYAGVYCLFARDEMLSADRLVSEALTKTCTRKVGKTTVTLSPMICGFTAYNSPLTALALSGGHGEADISEQVTQYQAYEQFLDNRTAVTLLGTQRDMYRLSKREQDGRIDKLAFAPLAGYTDLVQYLGISAATENIQPCERFAQYLIGEESQSTLVNICMFSVCGGSYYTDERYALCEAALPSAYVPNVFGDGEAVARQRKAAIESLGM